MSTLLRIDFTLNHAAQQRYGHEGTVQLTRGPGESGGHVLMKLLSYFVFFHDDLVIEGTAHQHYKPDLVRLDERGDPLQWVDCGSTSLMKLEKIARKNKKTHIDIVKKTAGELAAYKLQAEKRLGDLIDRVRFFAFDDGFVDGLTTKLQARHRVVVTVVTDDDGIGGTVFLDVDGTAVETRLRAL